MSINIYYRIISNKNPPPAGTGKLLGTGGVIQSFPILSRAPFDQKIK